MALSTAFQNAGSGLAVTSRQIHTLSANVANALTPGYAPRQVLLGQAATGGVRIAAITRQSDPILLTQLRDSAASFARAEAQAGFWQKIETALGLPESLSGVAPALQAFQAALVSASERPDLEYRLVAIESSAQSLVQAINEAGKAVQAERGAADAAIAADIGKLNAGLEEIHQLNQQIQGLQARGLPAHELQDARENLLGALAEIVPLRSRLHDGGRMTVYSANGQLLLDLTPVRIGFAAAGSVSAGQTLAGGQLSGLTINGQTVLADAGGLMAGGRLEAGFTIRDRDGVAAQSSLDDLAADLVLRAQESATDPSLAAGAPGLFSDAGLSLVPLAAPGLAGRLLLNPLVRPGSGGDPVLLRDGLGGGLSTGPGDPAQLQRWLAALDLPRMAIPGGVSRSFEGLLATTMSGFGQAHQRAESETLRRQSGFEFLQNRVLEGGVDTDLEMQHLMHLEEIYAANARVLQVVDDLLRQILEI